MTALFPVLLLAVGAAVARLAAAALLGGQRWQCDSADWALGEDHCPILGQLVCYFGAALGLCLTTTESAEIRTQARVPPMLLRRGDAWASG